MDFWPLIKTAAQISVMALSSNAVAYDSGSTGADGAFSPTVDTELTLPANGIFNFSEVTVPAGVTVTFVRNAANTPVFILASGDITIDGTIDVSGDDVPAAPGPIPQSTDNDPGLGGPGGFNGGQGGFSYTPKILGISGRGPEGGGQSRSRCGGGGGGYGTIGENSSSCSTSGLAGGTYGSSELALLIGGSGGGGGGADKDSGFQGQGGSGGGGAILLAASAQISVNGAVLANGGNVADLVFGRGGGAGSGGAIRIVAETLAGSGVISAVGGTVGTVLDPIQRAGIGGDGRIRVEASFVDSFPDFSPETSFTTPKSALVSEVPQLRISSFGGVQAPAQPIDDRDIVLPGLVNNPVTVEFATANVPLGTVITLRVLPTGTDAYLVNSDGVTGSVAAGVANVDVEMLTGLSSLQAYATFTVLASLGDALSRYAMGERVKSVSLLASADGNVTELTTISGKVFNYPSGQIVMSGGQG